MPLAEDDDMVETFPPDLSFSRAPRLFTRAQF